MRSWLNWTYATRLLGGVAMALGLLWQESAVVLAGLGAVASVSIAPTSDPRINRLAGLCAMVIGGVLHEGVLVIAGLGALGAPTFAGKDATK